MPANSPAEPRIKKIQATMRVKETHFLFIIFTIPLNINYYGIQEAECRRCRTSDNIYICSRIANKRAP
jgi:hypothetical protein